MSKGWIWVSHWLTSYPSLTDSLRQKPSVENTLSATLQHVSNGSPESHLHFSFSNDSCHFCVLMRFCWGWPLIQSVVGALKCHSGKSGTCLLARCFCWLPWAGISISALNQTRELTQLGGNLTKIHCEHREELFLLLGPAYSYMNFNACKFSNCS